MTFTKCSDFLCLFSTNISSLPHWALFCTHISTKLHPRDPDFIDGSPLTTFPWVGPLPLKYQLNADVIGALSLAELDSLPDADAGADERRLEAPHLAAPQVHLAEGQREEVQVVLTGPLLLGGHSLLIFNLAPKIVDNMSCVHTSTHVYLCPIRSGSG